MIAYEFFTRYSIEEHIAKIRAAYGEKCDLMMSLMDELFPECVSHTRPEGGMFVWCELPEKIDMLDFVKRAIKEKVAVVPGTAFMVEDGDTTNCFRMNYTTPSDENIVLGMERLEKVKKDVC